MSKNKFLVGALALVAFLAFGASQAMAQDWGFSFGHRGDGYSVRASSHGYGGSYAPSYGYSGYSNTYQTYGYDRHAASHGRYETGFGSHSSGYASPYRHGVHHGYHYSPENRWHGGSHYGHR